MDELNRSRYIHGTGEEEQVRLSRLNDLINQSSIGEMRPAKGSSVLDVGSGLGQLTRAIARAVGNRGRVIGIERDERQIESCMKMAADAGERDLVDIRRADVDTFPLTEEEWGTFDIVHARFLLEHIPDPILVVGNMVKAARNGGRIILEDDDHDLLRLWPEPPGVRVLWEAYYTTYSKLGNDPAVGRKLTSILHAAGAQPTRITWIYFGACAGEESFTIIHDLC